MSAPRRLARAALRRTGWTPAHPDPVPGAVEEFSWKLAAGWVAVPPGAAPVRVTLHVGPVEAASTWAARPGPGGPGAGPGELRPFRFKVRGIWEFARRSHRITVRADGTALPIAGHGMFLRPRRNGTGTPAQLAERLAAGHVFSQTGYLQRSRKEDVAWQNEVLALYDGVSQVLREDFGYDAFVIYGSLLGAVREGGFIGHDIDFDAAYLSRFTDPAAVVAERTEIALRLVDRGFDVEGLRSALHLHSPSDPRIRIDLFHVYFDSGGLLSFPFGVAGTREVRTADWAGLEPRAFGPAQVLAPVCAEAVVEALYGPTWREPQPGFSWTLDKRTRAEAALPSNDALVRVYFANVHAHGTHAEAAPFAAELAARPDLPPLVIDLGCGDGRDAAAFGAAGATVVGLDRCEVGLRRARARALDAGFSDRVTFAACEFADPAALGIALAGARAAAGSGPEPALFYARLLFSAVAEDVVAGLLAQVAAAAHPGDEFAAEFRTPADAALPKAHRPRVGRRFLDGPAFGRRLAELGFDVLDEVEGAGLAPYGEEDPVLYRVRARRAPSGVTAR